MINKIFKLFFGLEVKNKIKLKICVWDIFKKVCNIWNIIC